MDAETDSCDETLKILSQDTYAQMLETLRQDSGCTEFTKIIDHPGTYTYTDENVDSATKCEISFDTFIPTRALSQTMQSTDEAHPNILQFSNFGGQVPDDRANMTYTDSSAPLQRPATSLSPSPMSMIPSSQPFGGAYNFQFEFGKQPKDTKSAAWTYSAITNKLYAQKDLSCPIKFRINANGIAHRLFIRAMPVYSKPEYLQEVVKRCPNHIQAPESANIPHRDHFIWCENQGATYVKDPQSDRRAVVIPYDTPPAGTPWVTYLFSFKCLNSCVGGPNRRELSIIYTLENSNQEVLGRASIDLRICACPGRDRKTEEGKIENLSRAAATPTPPSSTTSTAYRHPLETQQVSQPTAMAASQLVHERELLAVTKRPRVDTPSEVFTLTVKGRRNFELLSKIRDSLEMTEQLVPNNERNRYAEERRHNDAQRHAMPQQVQHVQQMPCVSQATTRLPQMASAFNFSSARSLNIKQDVVDSTQRCDGTDSSIPLTARGFDMTDNASTSPTVAEWLQNLSLSAYTDNFNSAGFTSMDQLLSEEAFTIKDLENMQLTKPTVSLIWKSLQEFRRSSNPQSDRPAVTETVSLPDSQGSSPSNSQRLSQNSTVSLASSGSFGRSLLEFTRCSIKLTVTNKKRPADVVSATDSSDTEQYTSKKHKAMKNMHTPL